jgi:hypothetical protein
MSFGGNVDRRMRTRGKVVRKTKKGERKTEDQREK